MAEIFRQYYHHKGTVFVFVIKMNGNRADLRIYLDKKEIKSLHANITREELVSWDHYSEVNPFEDLVNSAIAWVEKNG